MWVRAGAGARERQHERERASLFAGSASHDPLRLRGCQDVDYIRFYENFGTTAASSSETTDTGVSWAYEV